MTERTETETGGGPDQADWSDPNARPKRHETPGRSRLTGWFRHYSVLLIRAALLIVDLTAVVGAFAAAYAFRSWLGEVSPRFTVLERSVSFYASYWPVLVAWPAIFWREGLYPGLWLSSSEELRRLAQGTTIASLLVLTLTFVTRTGEQFSRAVALSWWGLSLFMLPAGRYAVKALLGAAGVKGDPAVLLGAGSSGKLVLERLAGQRLPVLDIAAAFAENPTGRRERVGGIPVAGSTDEASEWASARGIRTVVVAMPGLEREELLDLIEVLGAHFHRVVLVPDLIGLSTAETVARDLEGIHAVELRRNLFLRRNRLLKRGLDIAVAGLGLPLLLPLKLLISLSILLESGRPLLYGHERIGMGGSRFTALKFRTMVQDAEATLEEYLQARPELKQEWAESHKLHHDPRITRTGRLLRHYSLDELPQLWNVFKGDMSLVGPRPIVEEETPKYGEAISLYYQVRPGLTGLWQVSGRSELEYDQRVQLDAYYVRNWSVWLDLVIIARTFWAVVSGRGAY